MKKLALATNGEHMLAEQLTKGMQFNYRDLPKTEGHKKFYIYQIYNIKLKIVYVGQSAVPFSRLKQHVFSSAGGVLGLGNPDYWQITILDILEFKKAKKHSERAEVFKLESYYIRRAIKKYGIDQCANLKINKPKSA